MTATTRAQQLRRLVEESPALRLVRAGDSSESAAAIMALLWEHLGGEERRVGADELQERIDADLEQLRGAEFELKGTALGYLSQWRAAGYLVRRPSLESRGETYELSSGALASIRFLNEVESPKQTATESRLTSLAAQLRQLAIDTDPQSGRRLERLISERERIDAEIAAIKSGADAPLANERAAERLRDLLNQASAVPDDFARVRSEFEALNSLLRQQILESGSSQTRVLEDVFRDIDLIAQSDAGRTFRAFTDLILDPAIGGAFEDDVEHVLNRDFAIDMTPAQRRSLRQFISTLKEHTAEIQQVAVEFARGLRRYVESQDYRRDRVLRRSIQDALHSALAASEILKPWERVGLDLTLTSVHLTSVGMLRLHDPAEFESATPVVVHETSEADLEALIASARLSEIDFGELISNINSVLNDSPSASVREVLAAHPASQGLASVVGLLSLAARHGTVEQSTEHLQWVGVDGSERAADVRTHRFTGSIQ